MKDTFLQFWDRVNGEPYKNGVPEPVKYNFAQMNFSRIGGAELKSLEDSDICTTSAEDVENHLDKMKKDGINPTRLGDPMTDDEFKKFMGHTW